ncbi:hypothetical protein DFJ73DRAFT_808746 [Zopfochytrium polystomum]|nr:hypothetical protein DFJ73DRAFT_808746 [Zopfochytrium polystomum]
MFWEGCGGSGGGCVPVDWEVRVRRRGVERAVGVRGWLVRMVALLLLLMLLMLLQPLRRRRRRPAGRVCDHRGGGVSFAIDVAVTVARRRHRDHRLLLFFLPFLFSFVLLLST